MIVNTPDGPVNFPDSMGMDDIQNVLRQKYGFQGGEGAPAQAPTAPGTSAAAPSAPGAVGQGQQSPPATPGVASWLPGSQMLHNLSQTFDDAFTMGGADLATAKGGSALHSILGLPDVPSVDDLRAQTNAARAALPMPVRVATEGAGYAMGPGKLLGAAAPGGVLGAIGEGTAAGALGAAGHGENIVPGALTGGAFGLGGGLLSKAAGGIASKLGMGPDVNAAAGDITSSLKDTRDAAYDKMKGVFYKPSDLLDTLDQTKADIYASDPGGDLVGAAPRSMAALNSLYTRTADTAVNPTQTAHGILTTLDKLGDIQRSPGGPENDIAPMIKDRLNNFLQTANPVNPDLGPGDASNMLAAAKTAHQQYANARDLQQAAQSLRGFGQSPTGWAQSTAEAFHPDPNSPAYKALSNIANSGGAPGGQSGYTVTHGVVHPLIEGLALATLPPGIAPAAAAMATFMGAKPLLNKAMGAGSTASQLNSIYKAYPTLTGQQFKPPSGPDPGAALRALILGRAASGFQ
jgi:hypothetical protein